MAWVRQNNFKQTINAVWELLSFRTNKAFTSVLKLHNRNFGRVVIDNRCRDRRATSDFVLCRSCYIIELRIRDRNLELFVRFNEIRKVGQAASTLRESIILKRVQFDIERWRGVPNAGAAVAIPSNGCAIKLKTSRCTCCRCRGSQVGKIEGVNRILDRCDQWICFIQRLITILIKVVERSWAKQSQSDVNRRCFTDLHCSVSSSRTCRRSASTIESQHVSRGLPFVN